MTLDEYLGTTTSRYERRPVMSADDKSNKGMDAPMGTALAFFLMVMCPTSIV